MASTCTPTSWRIRSTVFRLTTAKNSWSSFERRRPAGRRCRNRRRWRNSWRRIPTALRFATAAKPIPTSYAREAFFGVSALKFTARSGASRFGRYRIRPDAGTQYLTDDEAAKQPADFLQDELAARLARGPVKFHLFVQLAEAGDEVNDPTVHWPDGRAEVQLGTITLTERADEADPEVAQDHFRPDSAR